MKSALFVLAAITVTLHLTACVATRYQPEAASGGYSETKLNANTYEVRFQANSFTKANAVGALLLRRAAELTLEAGQRYFLVSDQRPLSRGEDPAVIATVRILDRPAEGAADAVEVIKDTEGFAAGRLSEKAREQLRRLQ